MPKNKLAALAVRIVLGLLIVSLMVSSIRQIWVYRRVNRYLAEKKQELNVLEAKNQELKAGLEEAKSPGFVREQAAKLFGLGEGNPSGWPESEGKSYGDLRVGKGEVLMPKYIQWLALFAY